MGSNALRTGMSCSKSDFSFVFVSTETLKLPRNRLIGEIPTLFGEFAVLCEYLFDTSSKGRCRAVRLLTLVIFFLFIAELDLSNNVLTGPIPSTLGLLNQFSE
jgi:hypothetical protein